MANFDMRRLDARARYNLITGTVVPRPIALVTTRNADGSTNAAPFSFFNALGSAPPIVAFAPGFHTINPDRPKDTRTNVLRDRQFVVNMVSEELLDAMTIAAADFPIGESQLDFMGVNPADSCQIAVPRIAESPVNLECRFVQQTTIGLNHVLFGEVVHIHVRDDLLDAERMVINYEKAHFIGRMPGGSGIYARTRDLLVAPRISYAELKAGKTLNDMSAGKLPEQTAGPQRFAKAYDKALARTRGKA